MKTAGQDDKRMPTGMMLMFILLLPVFGVSALMAFWMPLGHGFAAELSWLFACLTPALLSASMMVAIVRARPVLRWLASVFIALLMYAIVHVVLTEKRFRPGADEFAIAWLLGAIVLFAVLPGWLYNMAFSARAKRYLGLL